MHFTPLVRLTRGQPHQQIAESDHHITHSREDQEDLPFHSKAPPPQLPTSKDRMPPRGRRKKTQEPEEPVPEPEIRDDRDDPPPANDTSATSGANPPPQSSDDEGDGGASPPSSRPSRTPASVPAGRGRGGEDDVFKILICTDNHLGFAERDQIRGGDSFAAFEECFQLARHHGADFVLNSGDIFHENKPSRLTLHRVSYLLSTGPCVVPWSFWGYIVSSSPFVHAISPSI